MTREIAVSGGVTLPDGWRITEAPAAVLPCGCGCTCGAEKRDRFARRTLRIPGERDMPLIGNRTQAQENEMVRAIVALHRRSVERETTETP